jgi:short subunit dehydrogenase-like uncharacterized protein
VFTAYYSTGIPKIEDYVAARASMRRQLAFGCVIAPLPKFAPIRKLLLNAARPGPSVDLRARTVTHVWARLPTKRPDAPYRGCMGRTGGLVWTTITALGAARKGLNGVVPAGYLTPALALGRDFVLACACGSREDVA